MALCVSSRGFRLPTYTDLYYSDPANPGILLLKPESAWGFEGGLEWNNGGKVSLSLTAFRRRVRDGIDYVKYALDQPWQVTNFDSINYTGLETAVRLRLPRLQELDFAYTYLHANSQAVPGLISQYVFNYPSNNAVFSRSGTIKQHSRRSQSRWCHAACWARRLSALGSRGFPRKMDDCVPIRSSEISATRDTKKLQECLCPAEW